MLSQEEYNVTTQRSRTLYCKMYLMNEDFKILDEISGDVVGNPSFTIEPNSSIRRTCSITIFPKDTSFDISKGNKIWFNRYIQIYIGIKSLFSGEIVYTNMGIYVINSPNRTYDATTHTISIQGSDLMIKLTGNRNGNIEGMEYQIEADSNIRNAIISTLKLGGFNKYVVSESKYTVPNLISIDVGGSLFDILNQLLQIDPTYQMYFDVDGVFHYEPIPNGKDAMIMIDDDIWNKTLISYNDNFDFESVKNEIEVLGDTWDKGYYFCETVSETLDTNTTLNVKLKCAEIQTIQEEDLDGTLFAFATTKEAQSIKITLGYDKTIENETDTDDTPQTEFVNVITDCILNNIDKLVDTDRMLLFELNVDSQGNKTLTYISDLRPRAVVKCENPTSPFFIGAEFKPINEYGVYVDSNNILYLRVYDTTNPLDAYHGQGLIGFNLPNDFNGYRVALCDYSANIISYCSVNDVIKKGYNIYKYEYIPSYNDLDDRIGVNNRDWASKFSFVCIDNDYYMEKSRIVLNGGEYDNISTQSLAEQRARYEYYQYCQLPDSVTITCVPIYWLDTNWVTTITLPNKQGTPITEKYLITNINTSFGSSDTQSVTLTKYNEYNTYIGI